MPATLPAKAQPPSIRLAEPGMHPLDYHIADFLHAKALKAEKTQRFYELALRLYREHVGMHWPPSDSSINSFLAGVKARGCKPWTVHAYYRSLRTWCNWLYARGKIDENPIRLVDEPERQRGLPRAPRAANVARLLVVLNQHAEAGDWRAIRDLAIIGLLYDTGMRVGELVSLRVEDVYLRFCIATLSEESKTDEARTVCYEEVTSADLARWLRIRGELRPETPALFISSHRGKLRALTADGVRFILAAWCEYAGIQRITPHKLRHAYAIHALRNGADLLDVQRQLGHKKLETTQRYTLVMETGRRQRHAQHSPRKNLGNTVRGEAD